MTVPFVSGQAFLILTPNMFTMSLPLFAAIPRINSIPSAVDLSHTATNHQANAAPATPRIVLNVSPLKDAKDMPVTVAAQRLGDHMTDAVALVDDGIVEGRIEDFQKILGWDGPSIKDRIDELLPQWGIDPKQVWPDLADADYNSRMIRIHGEGKVSPEHFVQYSFFQRGVPPVALLHRIYGNEAYRRPHIRFMRADLEILQELPDSLNDALTGKDRFSAISYLNWAKSLSLGIEVGAKQIMGLGGAEDLPALWNERVIRTLDLMWAYLTEVHLALLANKTATSEMDTSYRSLLTYLGAVGT